MSYAFQDLNFHLCINMNKGVASQQDEAKASAIESQSRESPTIQPCKTSSHSFASTVFVKTEPTNGNCCSVDSNFESSTLSESEVSEVEDTNGIHIVSIESTSSPQENPPKGEDRYLCKSNSPKETSLANSKQREESDAKIDVSRNEDDVNAEHSKGWKKNEHDEIPAQRDHSEKRFKQHKDQGTHLNGPTMENDYERYGNTLFGDPKERPDFPHYSSMRGALPTYRSAAFYPTSGDFLKPKFVYMPTTEGIDEREAALRRAYYEDMMQQHPHLRSSAFQKPSDFGGNQEMKFLGPAMPFGFNHMVPYFPFYGCRPTANELLREKGIDFTESRFQETPNLSTQDKHKNEHRDQKKRASEEYKMYESNKHIGLDRGVPYPYLPYRTPVLTQDKMHPEAQCMYPCCTVTDKMTRPIEAPKLSPYLIYPMHAQAFRQLNKNQPEVPLNNPNEMHPSFKEFLEAERQRLAADNKLAQEKQKKFSNNLMQNFNTLTTLNTKKGKDTNKVVEATNPSKQFESISNLKNSPPSQNKQKEKIDAQITGAQGLTEKPSNEDSPPVKKIACNVCNKTFNRTSNLYTHMRTHSTHKPHVCEFCGKRFHQKADLRIHRYIHTGEKPHKCTKCGRGFKQLTHLKYHMRTHSDVRMYKCPYCEKGFNQKSNLQAHIFGHTGQRPHKCDVCGKGFTLASTLNTHKRTHLPNKPFQCQFCERAFYQKNALKMHYVSTHPYSSGAV